LGLTVLDRLLVKTRELAGVCAARRRKETERSVEFYVNHYKQDGSKKSRSKRI
jgi:hypothetical protein